jgi:hypothetical protein
MIESSVYTEPALYRACGYFYQSNRWYWITIASILTIFLGFVLYGVLVMKIFGGVLMSLGICSILTLMIILLATIVSILKFNIPSYYIGEPSQVGATIIQIDSLNQSRNKNKGYLHLD